MRVGLSVAFVTLLLGCSAQPAPTDPVAVFNLEYVMPANGAISIGGYGVFARLTDAGDDLVWNGRLSSFGTGEAPPSNQVIGLAPGEYAVTVNVLYASDAIVNGHVEYGPTATTCTARFQVAAGEVFAVTVTQIGGESCAIGVAS